MPDILPSAAATVQPVAAGGVQAAVPAAAPPGAAPAAAAMRQGEALVVESGDGFAVVAFDGRLLGLDGPFRVPAGGRLGLRLPQGSPGIGGSAAGSVSTRQDGLAIEVPVTVRLAARHGAAVPVQVTEAASGAGLQALLLPLPESGYGQRRGTTGEPTGRTPLIAVVVDDGAPDTVRLHTAAGSFLLPRGETVPPAGSQVALLPMTPVERRENGRTSDEARPEPSGDGGAAAPVGADDAEPGVPSAPARIPAQPPIGLPLSIGLAGAAAAGIAIEQEGGGSDRQRVDRLLIAVAFSRLGPVQIDLSHGGEVCDIVLRSQLALDSHTRTRIGEAVRAATGGRILPAFATGLAAAAESPP